MVYKVSPHILYFYSHSLLFLLTISKNCVGEDSKKSFIKKVNHERIENEKRRVEDEKMRGEKWRGGEEKRRVGEKRGED